MGAQNCLADGSGFDACVCDTAGIGGSAAGGIGGEPAGERGGPTAGSTGNSAGGAPGGAGGQMASGTGGVVGTGGVHGTGGSTGGAGGAIGSGGAGGYTGRFATVLIEDALIGPAKVNGDPWDEGNPIPQQVFVDLNAALTGPNPFTAAVAVLGEKLLTDALSATEKPDVVGTMRLDVAGQIGTEATLVASEERSQDSYTPVFPAPRGYSKVPIDADVRLHIHLQDDDVLLDDDIGAAVINAADMQAALAARKKVEVPIWDQTNKQILFIGISVQ